MPTKQKSRFKILWYIFTILAIIAVSVVVIPPMIHLNFLKPKIEEAILSKTNIPVKILGDVNVGLSGRATIVAHNLSFPNGTADSCEFTIPFFDVFDIKNAKISDKITVNGASVHIDKIVPFYTNIPLTIRDSTMYFLNKEYKIIDASLSKEKTHAIVRTDQHKYEITSQNNRFVIKNKNNDLNLVGFLFPDGTATADINITAKDINKWFEFETPRIHGTFPITAKMNWNGKYGIDFYDISANGLSGSIQLQDDGYKIIDLKSDNADYDMSFLLKKPEIIKNASLSLDFYGRLKFGNKLFKRLKVRTVGSDKEVKIDNIIADDMTIQGGTIDENGAHDVTISGPLSGLHTTCLFNGTTTNWSCRQFSHGNNITSVFSVKNDIINADVYSTEIYEDMKPFVVTIRKLASSGEVRFYYPDMDGTLHLKKDSYIVDYTRLDDRSLNQAKIDLKFLPDFMKDETGDFVWINGVMIFTPNSKQWQLSKSTGYFILRGDNFKHLTKTLDLQALNDLSYVLSGNYKNGNISSLILEIADQKFVGSASIDSVTLKTNLLNADNFINKQFMQNFEDLSFFATHPLTLPFDFGINIALSANTLIYNNERYNNFVYSLHKNSQTFSITDSDRGNLLATINKNNIKYKINIQLNKFDVKEKLLPQYMPLNISDTMITAEIKLNTSGKIAHDIIHNLNGDFDISFDGGKIYGLGIDDFYAYAKNISLLNVEQMLTVSLSGGVSDIKKMRIIGSYDHGDIKTTRPFTLSMKHVDANGTLEIENNNMIAKMQLNLRATAPSPTPIDLTIYPDDSRDFSLSEIMLNFDPEYMRAFINTHDQF